MKKSQIKNKRVLIIEDKDRRYNFLKDEHPGLIICSKKKWLSSRKIRSTLIPFFLQHGGSLILLSDVKIESVENKITFWEH